MILYKNARTIHLKQITTVETSITKFSHNLQLFQVHILCDTEPQEKMLDAENSREGRWSFLQVQIQYSIDNEIQLTMMTK